MTPGEYIRGVREARHVTLEDLALGLDSTPPISHRSRVDLLWAIEADFVPVSLSTAFALSALLSIDIERLAELVERHPAEGPALPRLRPAKSDKPSRDAGRAAAA